MNEIELTKSLINYKSITPENDGVLEFLENELTAIGFNCKRYKFTDKNTPDVDNLYAKFGNEEPNFCFGGHTDVVPIGDESAWSFDPFKGSENKGKIYGRGSSDMKSAIAAFICAAREFINSNKFRGSISLLITNDEEGPAINGTKKVLDKIYSEGEKIASCLVGEPTSPKNLGEMIKIGRRGSLMATINITGKQGHVAYPQWNLNPIEPLNKIIHELNSLKLDEGSDEFPPSNIEFVNISSSEGATNVVPNNASAQLNIRFNTDHTSEDLQKLIGEIVEKFTKNSDYKSQVDFYCTAEPFLTQRGKFTSIIKKSVDEITGLDSDLSTTGGTSDARFFKDYCEVVEFGLVGKSAHQIDENVEIEDISKLKNIYKNILKNYFN